MKQVASPWLCAIIPPFHHPFSNLTSLHNSSNSKSAPGLIKNAVNFQLHLTNVPSEARLHGERSPLSQRESATLYLSLHQ
jgi:hypothetical protein